MTNHYELFKKLGDLDRKTVPTIAPQHKDKNRYSDVLPYDFNLIQDIPFYFNASIMKISGLNTGFIATQGPIPNTFSDFWKVLHIKDIKTIVMLVDATPLESHKVGNCHVYWPEQEPFISDNVNVRLLSKYILSENSTIKNKCDNVIVRTFEIDYDNTKKVVEQFHYQNWVDRSIVDKLELFQFVKFFNEYMVLNKMTTDPIVHCSAGCGRTGVFINIYTAYLRLLSKSSNIEILTSDIIEFRSQRRYFVQTLVLSTN
eukprot:NODE_396_length_8125_cov_0.508472.p4 type:complete len:258 gc:universal NODE_396_length_8125_cov_0.508472:5246-6019(+)